MQLLGTKEINSWDKKKSRNLLGQKITQPLNEKNHGTTRDKQNHATSEGKKMTQPLKTEKITLSIDPISSKLFHKALNCSKWHQICPNRSK